MQSNRQALLLMACGTAILLIIPTLALIIGWQWHPDAQQNQILYWLYVITESGTIPIVFGTCVILSAIPLIYLKPSMRNSMLLILLMAANIGIGQGIKSGLKNTFQESRPYVAWMQQTGYITEQEFYSLSREQRTQFILEQDFLIHNIKSWQQLHWSKETGYSFPSGHSIFVAQWLLLYLLLLWRHRFYTPVIIVGVWALGIEASRIGLGMHWPADVILSCLLANIIVYPIYVLWQRLNVEQT